MGEAAKTKVHIGVSRKMQNRLEQSSNEEQKKVAKELKLENPNFERLKSFGILTGLTKPDDIPEIEAHEDIDFVEKDTQQKIQGSE